LKEVLLQASLRLIAEVGPSAFTLREVARRAGVSHNAPYRHFHNKEELLAVLACEGFEQLTASMVKASQAGSNAMDRFRLSGRGYVQFALTYPQHFAIMFDVPWRLDRYPEARAAGERAFETLVGYVKGCQSEGFLPEGDWQPLALLAWSMVHGVAKLALSERLPFSEAGQVLQFTDIATKTLRLGLANYPHPVENA